MAMDGTRALREAIEKAGGVVALARELGITHPAIAQWRSCPPLRVLEVERITGVSRHRLRPDLYPEERRKRA
jgi:DNA-binding transcriptional regulator YdaS (Cro superfamily)